MLVSFTHKLACSLLVCFGLWLLPDRSVFADVAGIWQLSGNLQANVVIKRKAYSIKQNNLNGITAKFNTDRSCEILIGEQTMAGTWTASKRSFKSQLSEISVSALLKSIEKDLVAKSGLQVIIEDVEQAVFSGIERKNGELQGSLKIRAKTLYLGYGYKAGSLSVTYDFVAVRNQS